ncbi:hypothetical protein [Shewanella baltica]|uniref:hypothetical protein n=1 Tax=Shewanella baltica TaxID=62322 RepID=UPI00014F8DFF|nr:hypothetical protein [Shewanella baltica]ABS08222.1 hypothetical protein Shew185_2080 [Shewanella baltica OS185]
MDSTDKTLRNFHTKIDADVGLKSKRRALIVTSIVLIIISWTGATLKEITGLVAKIELTNTVAIKYLLIISIAYLMFRYFAYARTYHQQLRSFWVKRFMQDKRVFRYYVDQNNPHDEDIDGLLGKALDVWVGDEPSVRSLGYENHGFPFFGRKITYITREGYSSGHPDDPDTRYEEVDFVNEIILNKFTDKWKIEDLIKLLSIEYGYVFKSYTHYREYFDLMGPYFFGILALLSPIVAPQLIN